ncbi:MAG: NAD(P)/FAD-dependent oxidoreductase [Candidatus Promineifilaceae bacterium]|nr:NAD(P)/FAD-dependent oxidoreductase [Candidatus Promineifilaceae bacterium]
MSDRQRIGVVGAGITGLSAAYDLLAAGHDVTVLEAADHAGGLAAGFRAPQWEWPLEKFYHHLFTSDEAIIRLSRELGLADDLFFPRPVTSLFYQGEIVPFDSPLAWLRFPGFTPFDVARFGLVSAYLRFSNPWRRLEQVTADAWMRSRYGDKLYEMIWRPLLIGKFGPYYQQANMAWMWARLKVRSPRLGYFRGGFQHFVDALAAAVEERGGQIRLRCPVRRIDVNAAEQHSGRLHLYTDVNGDEPFAFDRLLVTTSPSFFSRMAPGLPPNYLSQLAELKSMGAVVLILALRRQLMAETYWLNIPARTAAKEENEIPFLALVEHTNFIDRRHYGGDHLVYCGDYVVPDHDYLSLSKESLLQLFTDQLHHINPAFRPDWVRDSWLFRARYAQPVPEVDHARRIPALRSPLPGVYFASMSQVYPWDRGTNFAVKIGREVAQLIAEDIQA